MLNALSHYYLPGALAIWCALFFAVAGVWGYLRVVAGDASSLIFARRAYACFALSIGMAAMVLLVLLQVRDFRIEYVFQYSGLDLPGHYQLASFWAGQKGSFMIWLLWGTLLGLLVRRTAGKAEAPVMGIYLLTLMGLLLILVRESPFVMLRETPADGQGLNPLLQDNWMVIHPPIMFVGYAAAAIPFAFAMAALWRRDYDGWAARAFPWALGGFLVLGTAILMGGYWAYKTLGWGGYWGWDPVENASLIPWLFGTVMIHGLHMERRKGRYRRANFIFATLTYMSVLYGTFLTRSGVLADFSVHSFVDLGISGWLIGLMGFFALLSVVLLTLRLREVPTQPIEDPLLSRGIFMLLATIVVLVSAVAITFGTSAPLISRFLVSLGLMKNQGQVGPEWYNLIHLPITILIAGLLSFVPYLTWKGEELSTILRKLVGPAVFSLAVTVAAALWRVDNPLHLAIVALAALALATNLHKAVLKFRSGGLKSGGGYLSHVGVGVILLGILASSGYDQSTKATLIQGQPKKVGDLTLTFKRFLPREGSLKERMEIEVVRAGDKPFFVYPKLFANDRTKQTMANPDIKSSPFQDLYVSPIDYDPGQSRLQLAKGETGRIGDLEVKFINFDLSVAGNALANMQSGKPLTIGAVLAVTRNGQTTEAIPLYRLDPATGEVRTPPLGLPGGGAVLVSGINASTGAVEIELPGAAGAAKLSIDVTKKPLIQLVWFGLYIVLAGGIIATVQRLRELRLHEAAGKL
jgi:cytochrome c-type biogenesis protein CcmF